MFTLGRAIQHKTPFKRSPTTSSFVLSDSSILPRHGVGGSRTKRFRQRFRTRERKRYYLPAANPTDTWRPVLVTKIEHTSVIEIQDTFIVYTLDRSDREIPRGERDRFERITPPIFLVTNSRRSIANFVLWPLHDPYFPVIKDNPRSWTRQSDGGGRGRRAIVLVMEIN